MKWSAGVLCLLVAAAAVSIGLTAQQRNTQDRAGLVAVVAGTVALVAVVWAFLKSWPEP